MPTPTRWRGRGTRASGSAWAWHPTNQYSNEGPLFYRDVGIEHSYLFPKRLGLLDEFNVSRGGLIGVVSGAALEDDVQRHVELQIIHFALVIGQRPPPEINLPPSPPQTHTPQLHNH